MPSLEFTLMVGCPLKCTYCPQDALKGSYGKAKKYMSPGDFRTILSKVPDHVRIDFSGMAEPWSNPDATLMLVYAVRSGRTLAVYTTLYGMAEEDAATVALWMRMYPKQIEVLNIHLPDANGNMRGWKYSPEYEANLRRFWALKDILPRFEAMTMDGSGRVHPDLASVVAQLGQFDGHTRAGNVTSEDVGGQAIAPAPRHSSAVMCSFTPFYDQNVVLPNGDVVLCCMDYSIKHRLGNLLDSSYYEIFSGGALSDLRAENMKTEFSGRSLCRTCNRARPLRVGQAKQFWV